MIYPTSANHTVYLIDMDGTTVLDTWTIDKDVTSPGWNTSWFQLATPRTLTKNGVYYILLLPGSAAHIQLKYTTTINNGSTKGEDMLEFVSSIRYVTCNGAPAGHGSFTADSNKRPHFAIKAYQVDIGGSGGGLILHEFNLFLSNYE